MFFIFLCSTHRIWKEINMINKNYSVLERIGLEIPVIGVKFAMTKPADLPKLKEKVALCGMLKYAQDNGGFYASAAEHECKLGPTCSIRPKAIRLRKAVRSVPISEFMKTHAQTDRFIRICCVRKRVLLRIPGLRK